jgi:hypothetical protein
MPPNTKLAVFVADTSNNQIRPYELPRRCEDERCLFICVTNQWLSLPPPLFAAIVRVCSGPEVVVSLVSSSMPANTKLAVFDAVTSNTALVLPVQHLVQLCRDR